MLAGDKTCREEHGRCMACNYKYLSNLSCHIEINQRLKCFVGRFEDHQTHIWLTCWKPCIDSIHHSTSQLILAIDPEHDWVSCKSRFLSYIWNIHANSSHKCVITMIYWFIYHCHYQYHNVQVLILRVLWMPCVLINRKGPSTVPPLTASGSKDGVDKEIDQATASNTAMHTQNHFQELQNQIFFTLRHASVVRVFAAPHHVSWYWLLMKDLAI